MATLFKDKISYMFNLNIFFPGLMQKGPFSPNSSPLPPWNRHWVCLQLDMTLRLETFEEGEARIALHLEEQAEENKSEIRIFRRRTRIN